MSEQQWPAWLPLRTDLQGLSPYGAPQVPAQATLNTNENPYAPSKALAQAIADRTYQVALNLNRYPDRDAVVLRKGLANFVNNLSSTQFGADQIWAANGSNEIIQSLFMAFGDRPALGFTPSYSMHPLIAKVTGTSWRDGGRRADFSLDLVKALNEIAAVKPALTFITTPNNPTGTTVTLDEIAQLAQAAVQVNGLLIVDEAYAEFSELPSAVTLINKYQNLVVIRTMSKAFAFAGARLGYLVANQELVSAMFLVRLPYHLSSLTQAAAEVALEFQGELLGNVSTLINSRKSVISELEKMGLQVVPSQANFILFTGFNHEAAQLWRQLLDRGVLIRNVGLLAHLRMTIGNEAENQKFIDALQEILNGESQ
ncbi:HisC Histidinol-phosphate/aromatic aminotransferase and cobyric acid decarboxylase [Candidatus Nanopelagicaceae bacterium]